MTNYWNGNQSTSNGTVNMTMTSYYTNTRINSTSYTSTVTSGTSTSRNDTDLMGSVQGNNKGIYTNNVSGLLSGFNSRTTDNINWKYENSSLSLIPRLTVSVTETSINNYSANVSDLYSIGTYNYKWYNNGTLDGQTQNYECAPSFTTDQEVMIIVNDGEYYSALSFTVEKLYIDLEISVNNGAASATASLVGTALPYIDINDYTFTWYKEDISGEAEIVKEVQGSSGLTLTNLEQYYDYRLVATHSSVNELTVEKSFTFGERTVVYCDYINGNNGRDGRSEATAVKTLATAYGKLDSNGNRNKNIIVLMNDYNDSNETTKFLNSSNNSSFARKATITGKYKDKDYDPDLCFEGYRLGYRYLNEDTTFMYLNLDGYYYTYNWRGQLSNYTKSQTYFYLQGFSLTIGEDVVMKNYAKSNTNQGLLGGNAPAFHIFSCWLQYNYSNLPRNNPEVLIKSGTYARIMGGGSPGTSEGQGQTTSHDFTGTSSNPFNITITIDIKNSTKSLSAETVSGNTIDYDVNLLGGGSATGNNYSNATINIKNGTVGRVLGASIGDSQTRQNNWNYPCNTYLGTATVNITGGTTTELYGGCLGRNMGVTSESSTGNTCDSYFYGTATINISGGEVQNNIYGAGAGGVSGYDAASSDTYRSYGQNYATSVNINISGGTIDGNIFGGGYGYTEYLNENTTAEDGGFLYGNSNIIISGSPTINGNIYGAGCGYNYSNKTSVAGMKGTSYIEINDTPTISGKIFGAGAGISGRDDMAKLSGNSNIKINTDLGIEGYGGGNIAKLIGNSTINLEKGTHTADIYGGGNLGLVEGTATVNIKGDSNTKVFGGGNQATVTDTIVNISGGTNTEVYGGGNKATVETTKVIITGGTTTTLFGGGNQAEVDETEVRLNNGTVTTIYGAGNQAAADVTNVYLTGGTNATTYGGGNQAGAGETHVYCNGTTFTNIVDGVNTATVYGGSNTSGDVTTSNVEFNSGTIPNIYGGNNQGGTTETANVVINNGTITNAFGGGNKTETTNTNVTINNGTITSAFGGGNQGETTSTNVTIYGGTITNAFGGGNQAETTTSNVTIHGGIIDNTFGGGDKASTDTTTVTTDGGIILNIYGGGNQAGATTTNVITNGGNIDNVFGGSNRSGNVTTSNVTTNDPTSTDESGKIKMEITSTVEDAAWRKSTYPDYPTYAKFTVKVINNTTNTLEHWNGNIYVKDSMLYSNYSSTQITESNGKYTFNEVNRYYGTNQVAAGETYSFEIEILSKQSITDFKSIYMLSGTDSTGKQLTYTENNINKVYGGNNEGGTTSTTNVTINGGNALDVFGGGNRAETNATNVNINGSVQNDVFGGGNQAGVNTNTNVNLNNGTV